MKDGMIIGTGLLASSFEKHINKLQGICIFASGVSNSSCTDEAEFARELNLLKDTFEGLSLNESFAYFSTCSVYDPTLKHSAYIKHKQKIELMILQRKNSHIFRLPQLAGNSKNTTTLLNFLSNSIESSSPINIWSKAERNIIDVEDATRTVIHYIKNHKNKNIIANVCNPCPTKILDIVRMLEKIKGKSARVNYIEGGSFYDIPLDHTKEIYREIGLTFKDSYLEDTLRKYYSKKP
ncbi:MAG: hypothetical protein IV088_10285 [Hydrogenophaga sp.]|uniref:NAD-dependent epimerase/dehydratase family protein n=1 Tax=Hydrogenophaga sp. TaxID=1904254 RepID=UPI0025B7E909|nr:hypothetical protein [Hydrogenophaga sp.]MBT9551225.1 hypothetical protein [Hydrogenophaga sp.]